MNKAVFVLAFLVMMAIGANANAGLVCFYEHINYQGEYACWKSGDTVKFMGDYGWNDRASSIYVEGGSAMVYVDANFGGASIRVNTNLSDLRSVRYPNGNLYNWNDLISSIVVE